MKTRITLKKEEIERIFNYQEIAKNEPTFMFYSLDEIIKKKLEIALIRSK